MADAAFVSKTEGAVDNATATWNVSGPTGNTNDNRFMILGFSPKTATISTYPSGWVFSKRVDALTDNGAAVLLTNTLGVTATANQPLTVTFTAPVKGAWAAVSASGVIQGTGADQFSQMAYPFAIAQVMPSKTATANGSLVVALKSTGANPKNSIARSPMTTRADQSGGTGPSVAIGTAPLASGVTLVPTFDARDYYGNSAYDGDTYQGWSILLGPTTSVQTGATLSGGGVIPVVGVESVLVSGPSSLTNGQAYQYTVTVVGTDGQPFGSLPVQASVTGGATLDAATKTTNASGVATFTLTANQSGSFVFAASSAGKTSQASYSVTTPTSNNATSVVVTGSLPSMQVGQTVVVTVQAMAGSVVAPARNGVATITRPGQEAATQAFVTDQNGRASFIYTAVSVGTYIVSATVDSATSNTLSVPVSAGDPIIAVPSQLTLRYPGADGSISIRKGSATVPGLAVSINSVTVASVSPITASDGSIQVIPRSVGLATITVTYPDPVTSVPQYLYIPLSVTAAQSTATTAIRVRGVVPQIVNGAAPITVTFEDQNGNLLVDKNLDRFTVEVDRPKVVNVSHASDNGVILIYGCGVGSTKLFVEYVLDNGKVARLEVPVTVVRA